MLNESAVRRALLHLTTLGDTDIFPAPFEFNFFREQADKISAQVSSLDFGAYRPRGCVEVLSPKGSLSFRIAHQLYPADSVIYTAAVLEIAAAIESLRQPLDTGPFSYRFVSDDNDPRLFAESSSYHDWIEHLQSLYKDDSKRARKNYVVVETDISDFYSRIYFHRIEHVLDDVEATNAVRRIIEGIIKFSRGRQSYGLPVGSSASRILAEGLLNDTDVMIVEDAVGYSRYVDDFRIVTRNAANAHEVLCRLASHLMLTEGLSLNSSKTRLHSIESALKDCDRKLSDVFSDDSIIQVSRYIRRVYQDGDVSVEEIDDVDPEEIVGRLRSLLERDSVDYGAIKVLLRALRATGHADAPAIVREFGGLLYYLPRDFCLMAGALAQRDLDSASAIAEAIVAKANESPADQMILSKVWVAHLFITQALPVTKSLLRALKLGDSTLERRCQFLLRGLLKDRSFFRGQKTSFTESSDWSKGALLFGASCISRSEYRTWLDTIKDHYDDPFARVYLKWLRDNQDSLYDRLKEDFKVQSRIERMAQEFADLFENDDEE